jgi:hypothetical protein
VPDPIWLDTNAVSEAIKGDIDVRNQLQAFRGAGRKLLITSHVESELLNGNIITETKAPPPALRAAKEAALVQLGIETDRSADNISGQKRRSYIFETKAPSGEVSISDRMVLGTIKASAEARGVARPEGVHAGDRLQGDGEPELGLGHQGGRAAEAGRRAACGRPARRQAARRRAVERNAGRDGETVGAGRRERRDG